MVCQLPEASKIMVKSGLTSTRYGLMEELTSITFVTWLSVKYVLMKSLAALGNCELCANASAQAKTKIIIHDTLFILICFKGFLKIEPRFLYPLLFCCRFGGLFC